MGNEFNFSDIGYKTFLPSILFKIFFFQATIFLSEAMETYMKVRVYENDVIRYYVKLRKSSGRFNF